MDVFSPPLFTCYMCHKCNMNKKLTYRRLFKLDYASVRDRIRITYQGIVIKDNIAWAKVYGIMRGRMIYPSDHVTNRLYFSSRRELIKIRESFE